MPDKNDQGSEAKNGKDEAERWYDEMEDLDRERPFTGGPGAGFPPKPGLGKDEGFIDLPYESGSADPQPLEYDDLEGKQYVEGEDFREAQKRAEKKRAESEPEE